VKEIILTCSVPWSTRRQAHGDYLLCPELPEEPLDDLEELPPELPDDL